MKTKKLTITKGRATIGCPFCDNPKPVKARIYTDKGEHTGKNVETQAVEFNCPQCGPGAVLAGEVSDWNAKQEAADRSTAKRIAREAIWHYSRELGWSKDVLAIQVTVGRYTENAQP